MKTLKIVSLASLAALSFMAAQAHASAIPGGSYLKNCWSVQPASGNTYTAQCLSGDKYVFAKSVSNPYLFPLALKGNQLVIEDQTPNYIPHGADSTPFTKCTIDSFNGIEVKASCIYTHNHESKSYDTWANDPSLFPLENHEGSLKVALPEGPYLSSCHSVTFNYPLVTAACKNDKNEYVSTQAYNPSFAALSSDSKGHLQYAAPGGSYFANCKNITFDGTTLNAECLNNAHVYVKSAPLTNKDYALVGNVNGQLTVQAPGGDYLANCHAINFDGKTVKAACRTTDNKEVETSIEDANALPLTTSADGKLIIQNWS